jgi:hypothetical protein
LVGGDVSPRQCIFIHDFPSHPLSSWLKNSIPNYEKRSAKTRRLVAAKIQAFALDCVSALNAMLLNSFNTIHCRLDHAKEEKKLLKAALSCQDIKLQQTLDILQATHNQALWQPAAAASPTAPPHSYRSHHSHYWHLLIL